VKEEVEVDDGAIEKELMTREGFFVLGWLPTMAVEFDRKQQSKHKWHDYFTIPSLT
jgi:hypothetical protein